MTSSLTFSGAALAWPVAAFLAVAALALLWGYRAARGHPLRWVLAGLKAAGVAASTNGGAGPGEPCRTGYHDAGRPILANEKHDARQATTTTRAARNVKQGKAS